MMMAIFRRLVMTCLTLVAKFFALGSCRLDLDSENFRLD